MGKLDGKVAVVTGATSGMALATAKLFVKEGAYVFITGRTQKTLDQAVVEIGRNVTGVQADSGNLADLDRLFREVDVKKGGIDIVFASAGAWEHDQPIATISEESYDRTFAINTKGTFFTVQKAIPLLRDGASVILNGSIAGSKGIPGMAPYGASKAAVRSLARSFAQELRGRRVRANVISPGPIDTGLFANVPEEMRGQFSAMVPLGRMGRSEEIATAALFLASSDSSFITGIELFVDGGVAQL